MLISEIIVQFGVTRQAVAQAIREDRLPARMFGDRWLVKREDAAAYFASTNAAGRKRGRPKGRKNISRREKPTT